MVMLAPSRRALTSTPSIAPSSAEETCPLSATASCACPEAPMPAAMSSPPSPAMRALRSNRMVASLNLVVGANLLKFRCPVHADRAGLTRAGARLGHRETCVRVLALSQMLRPPGDSPMSGLAQAQHTNGQPTLSERADALEEHMMHELEHIVTKSVLFGMADGKVEMESGPSLMAKNPGKYMLMGADPRLPKMPDKPTLID